MKKNPPKLMVVDAPPPAAMTPAPPPGLAEAGAKLWQSIQEEYRIDDAGGRAMLGEICRAADRAAECAELIARDGATIRTKAGLKEHPLLKIELSSRSFVVRSLHRLGLDIEPTRDTAGRPPGSFNRTR